MTFNEHVSNVIRRSRAFYAAREPGHFLVRTSFPVDSPKAPALWDFELPRQLNEYLDHKLSQALPGINARQGIDDDSIPSVCPHFGIAEHSAWLGMDVRLQEDTCLPTPIINEPADLDKIVMSESHQWFKIMKDSYDYLRSRKDGTFVLSVRGTMAPMDLANAIRGDELYTDVLLEPEFSHRLMRLCTDALKWYYPQLRSWADSLDGGNVFAYGSGWMPDCVGHLSNDAAFLCSASVYEEFGLPYEAEITRDYKTALYHIHNEKLQFIPMLAALPNLALLEIAPDPKTPHPIDDLPRIYAATGSANLMLHVSSDHVRNKIEDLKVRNMYLDVSCKDRADAEDIISFVRSHSKPLA